MIDGTAMSEDVVGGDVHRPEVLASLEHRVRRLEDAVATMQDTRQLEERVVERLTRLGPAAAPASVAGPNSGGLLLEASRRLLPAAVDVIQAEARSADAQARQPQAQTARPPWLLVDMYAEARAMLHMYTDPRYRMTWPARLVPLLIFAAMLFTWGWFPGMSLVDSFFPTAVGKILTALVNIVLAYVPYKLLIREAARYRATAPDLPPHLRS